MTEEELKELSRRYPDEAIQRLIEEHRRVCRELAHAPTLEQMHSLVGQLKEARGENSKLREEIKRLSTVAGSR